MGKFFLVMTILFFVIVTAGCTTKYKTFSNEYMSFEYPENWKATPILDDVGLMEEKGNGNIYINPSLENLKDVKSRYGIVSNYIGEEKIKRL